MRYLADFFSKIFLSLFFFHPNHPVKQNVFKIFKIYHPEIFKIKFKLNKSMTKFCSCIIPFHNEHKTIIPVLEEISKVKLFHKIICVNDGSTDSSPNLVKKFFPEVVLINLKKNSGKTNAVKKGLELVNSEFVLLIDADLKNLKSEEISRTILKMKNSSNVDMIILKRLNSSFHIKLFRANTVLSGERIIKADDLGNILKKNIHGYLLEFAINEYMIKNNKKVFWTPSSAVNSFRAKKWGIKKSIKTNLNMLIAFSKYPGLKNLIIQSLTFAKNRI
ncbi:glycosyltransferase [Candidatus Woesearchaeota archaeon]|nr:glycosyltransferase [Candidatus Woesearchaeota archaeon]